jgi:hypothetical protein
LRVAKKNLEKTALFFKTKFSQFFEHLCFFLDTSFFPLYTVAIIFANSGGNGMSTVKIGWAQANITPLPEAAKKISLHGQWNERIGEDVHDPMHAVIMVMDDGKSIPTVLVSADLESVSAKLLNAVRKELKNTAPEIPSESLIICATHIHTGPFIEADGDGTWGPRFNFHSKDPDVLTPQAFTAFFAKKVAGAAAEAWKNRKSGGIVLKTGRIAVPQCRRVQYKDGTASMYGDTNTPNFLKIEGSADNGAEYLITLDEAGKVTGVVINLACPAQVVESEMCITADIWGEVRKQWPEMPYVLPVCGAAGDLTMRDLVRRDRTEASTRSFEGVTDIAGRIVRESKYIVSTIKKEIINYEPAYGHLKRDIYLPIRTVTEAEYIEAKRDLDAFEKEYELNGLAKDSSDSYPLRMKDRQEYARVVARVQRWEMQKKSLTLPMELHAFRFGDAVLVNNAFELYQEFGNQMKALSPAPYTFVVQLANDCLGYLCNSLAVSGGSYSAGIENGYIGPEGGDYLVAKTLDAIESVWDKK